MDSFSESVAPEPIPRRPRAVVALFAGVGGIELGLKRAGFKTVLMCESDAAAKTVLRSRFPRVPICGDVRELANDPSVLPARIDLLTAGFPCQDLSQAGGTAGIRGSKSGLVDSVFEILRLRQKKGSAVPWVLIENVPFMLQLSRGAAMTHIVNEFERLGYRWAYRVVDTRAFGLPQRRERVIFVASLVAEPATVLFSEDSGPLVVKHRENLACGFYWTEGNRGLGWVVNGVPTLKGGSSLGIPSAPGIWFPDGLIATPHICDAERLQGLPADWTEPAQGVALGRSRWRLVGNAVTVDVAEWVGHNIACSGRVSSARNCLDTSEMRPLTIGRNCGWPRAACGSVQGRYEVSISSWPVRKKAPSITEFLRFDPKPLSYRATHGFFERLKKSRLRRPSRFDEALARHRIRMAIALTPQPTGLRVSDLSGES